MAHQVLYEKLSLLRRAKDVTLPLPLHIEYWPWNRLDRLSFASLPLDTGPIAHIAQVLGRLELKRLDIDHIDASKAGLDASRPEDLMAAFWNVVSANKDLECLMLPSIRSEMESLLRLPNDEVESTFSNLRGLGVRSSGELLNSLLHCCCKKLESLHLVNGPDFRHIPETVDFPKLAELFFGRFSLDELPRCVSRVQSGAVLAAATLDVPWWI